MSATINRMHYLNPGLPAPLPDNDNLDKPYWDGTREGKLKIQRCRKTGKYQWGPEWLHHESLSYDLEWVEVEPKGVIYSWERVWHPVHPALKEQGPYLVVLVELPHAGHVRMIGNLLGDPLQEVKIGSAVTAVFEPHDDAAKPYTLVQWQVS
jgi:uncharacterized OB-fold protein